MSRSQVSEILEEIAHLLEISGANPFRVRAYQNGARIIENMSDFDERVRSETLTDVKGIGKGLNEHIHEFLKNGNVVELDELRKKIPAGVLEMVIIPGVGPKKAKKLWQDLEITSLEELMIACKDGRVASLDGLGEKSAKKILEGIDFLSKHSNQHLYLDAFTYASELLNVLKNHPEVLRAELGGSLRRHKEVVKDIDLVASSNNAKEVMDFFVSQDFVVNIVAHGETKSSVTLKSGINADLRIVDDKEFPYALHHFTGSKEHNTAMRGRSQSRGFKMNEYGLFKVDESGKETLVNCKDEAEIFAKLDLEYIPPELREDLGEIIAAENHTLPKLVEHKDIQGVFHCHTTYSDGKNSLREMVEAAQRLGLKYIGISDHSQSAAYAGGLKFPKVLKQTKEIAELNKEFNKIKIFHGIESDILKDGSLDYNDDELTEFDFIIASIHGQFNMTESEMTQRVCRAIEHPATRVLAHPTGRLLLTRESFALDMEAVLQCAAANNVAVEINCNPRRSELDWRWGKRAQELGVLTMISPDAHSTSGFDFLRYGVGIARKGWWIKENIINCWSLEKVNKWLKEKVRQ